MMMMMIIIITILSMHGMLYAHIFAGCWPDGLCGGRQEDAHHRRCHPTHPKVVRVFGCSSTEKRGRPCQQDGATQKCRGPGRRYAAAHFSCVPLEG